MFYFSLLRFILNHNSLNLQPKFKKIFCKLKIDTYSISNESDGLSGLTIKKYKGDDFLITIGSEGKIFVLKLNEKNHTEMTELIFTISDFKIESERYLLRQSKKYLWIGTRSSYIYRIPWDQIFKKKSFNIKKTESTKIKYCGFFPNFFSFMSNENQVLAPRWDRDWNSSSKIIHERLDRPQMIKIISIHSKCVNVVLKREKTGEIFSGSHDSTVVRMDLRSYKKKFRVKNLENGWIFDIAFNKKFYFAAGNQGPVAVISLKTNSLIKMVKFENSRCSIISFADFVCGVGLGLFLIIRKVDFQNLKKEIK